MATLKSLSSGSCYLKQTDVSIITFTVFVLGKTTMQQLIKQSTSTLDIIDHVQELALLNWYKQTAVALNISWFFFFLRGKRSSFPLDPQPATHVLHHTLTKYVTHLYY